MWQQTDTVPNFEFVKSIISKTVSIFNYYSQENILPKKLNVSNFSLKRNKTEMLWYLTIIEKFYHQSKCLMKMFEFNKF